MYNDPVWIDEAKTVIKFEYTDPISTQEIIESQDKAAVMLGQVDHRVQFVVDLRDMKSLPRDLISSYPAMSRGSLFKQGNLDRVVMVLDNSLVEAFISIFGRLYRKLEFARSMDVAYKLVGVNDEVG